MKTNPERGSAIIMLFVALALFGALAYAFMQGTRSNLGLITSEKDRALATQTQDCTNTVNMALKRLEARGCGSYVSANTDGTNSIPGAPTDGSCSIYHTNGGGVKPCLVVASAPADCTGLGSDHYNDPVSGHCYFRLATLQDSAASEALCQADGGYLAAITSGAENTVIVNNLSMSDPLFIGVSDASIEQNWIYTGGELAGTQFWSGDDTGSPVGGYWNNWAPLELHAGFGPLEDCAAMNVGAFCSSGTWCDYPCTGLPQKGLCEKTGTP